MINAKLGKKIIPTFIAYILLDYSDPLQAAIVSAQVPYQTFRDFAENKGRFSAGATGINIYDKSGNLVGALDKAAMPDFSATNYKSGVATLISPQYIISVKHNGGYRDVSFANKDNKYKIIARNNHPGKDFHVPRLNKLVTEVIPAEVTSAGTGKSVYKNKERFPVFYRVAGGRQLISGNNDFLKDTIWISAAYKYLTGGTVNTPLESSWKIIADKGGALLNASISGDSGSPLYAFDTLQNKWVVVGTLLGSSRSGGKYRMYWVVPDTAFIARMMDEDRDPAVTAIAGKGPLRWTFNNEEGTGSLRQAETVFSMHGSKGNDLNAGKNLTFSGADGAIILQDSINQGAGTLTFNDSYTVSPRSDQTWVGGGLDIAEKALLVWQVNGEKGDNLHKIGKGVLKVNGTGINEGGLKVGDGTVILAQQADKEGKVQAFSTVNIASGRPTVILGDDRQINPDNISWGFRGGRLDINGNDVVFHQLNATDNGAIISSNRERKATIFLDIPQESAIFHGRMEGNLNVRNRTETDAKNTFISDGGMDIPTGRFRQKNGRLVLQGHPVIHAWNSKGVANKLKSLGDDSVRTQPVSFDQPDWENRLFRIGTLELENTDFRLARNATLLGDIYASGSSVTLGSPSLYIDLNDGDGVKTRPQQGLSVASKEADMSDWQGNMTLINHSSLDVREKFTGSITARDSRVTVSSRHARLNDYSQFITTPVILTQDAHLVATGGWWSDGTVSLQKNALLTLGGTPVVGKPGQYLPAFYSAADYHPAEVNAVLEIAPYAWVGGDIRSNSRVVIRMDGDDNARVADNLTAGQRNAYRLFNGFKHVYTGTVSAPHTRMIMKDSMWWMPGNSRINHLSMRRSLARFGDEKQSFTTLNISTLQAEQSIFALRANWQDSDKIVITRKAQGKDNRLAVNFLSSPGGPDTLDIPLVTAPAGTDHALFKAAERIAGFSLVTPSIHVDDQNGKTKWVLDGFTFAPYQHAIVSATRFMNMGYKSFIREVNNLNKRMGDLRDAPGDAGLWLRIMNGAGSGEAGYADNYTHLQSGVDKQHPLNGAQMFTGVLMSYTRSNASSPAFSGNTRSLGGGIYTSVLFDSGFYLDVTGKYLHHDNTYNAPFAALGKRDYTTHSWYAGLETGYRYQMTDNGYLEPQAELVYGRVSAATLKWHDNGMDVSMGNKNTRPLTGRTGIAMGKVFSGEGWKVTARAGVDYQFDLVANGETVLRDGSGERRFSAGKDRRMLYHMGLNAQVRDDVRFSLELERSAFGKKYNQDHQINANFRYMF